MKLVAPSVPEFDLASWARRPERERVRMMCESWALGGFGAPLAAYALYVLKIAAYASADGVLASGAVHTADLLHHQPFPVPGSIDLHRDETARAGSTPVPVAPRG